ncbi:MAG: GDSL-type esterase/lipase family protein [Acetobacteraceae bacterium]
MNLLGPSAGISYQTNVSGQYTFSVWVRLISGNGNFGFNYFSGSSGTSVFQTAVATSTWQRLTWTFTGDGNAASNIALMHGVYESGDSVVELWGAQLNSGGSANAYVPTTGTVVNTTTSATTLIGSTLTVGVMGATPVATVDTASVAVGGTTVTSGNILSNDTDSSGFALSVSSVNGVTVSGQTTIVGRYGTLVIQPNGQYTYTLASSQANVQALAGGQTAQDSFTYTISDGQTHTQVTNQISQNLIIQSEAFGDASWVKFSSSSLPVITANVDPGPMGGAATADKITLSSVNSGIAYSTPMPGPYTFSVWVRLISGSGNFAFNYFEGYTNINYTQTATATTTWQRFTWTFNSTGTATSGLALELAANQSGGTFELWGAQLNPGTTAETYVPTTGTASTLSTPVTTPAPIGSTLTVNVAGTDTGKPGPALNFQNSTQGVIANLATDQWSTALTVMPLGDSITYGWSTQDTLTQSNTSEGYRGLLWSQFLANNMDINFVGDQSNGPPTLLDPLNAGYPGERTDQIAARLPGLLATQNPSDILLMAGTNDLKQGVSPATVAANILGMLQTVSSMSPSTRVYVATILTANSSVISAQSISTANSDIKAMVQSAAASGIKVTLVDMSNVTLSDISSDGVHPNPAGYAQMSQDWYSAILAQQPAAGGTPGGTATPISSSIASLIGSNGNDVLIGNAGPNFITAGSGNDILNGGGGNDTLVGGSGADEFVIGAAAGLVNILGFNPAKGDYLDWNNIPGLTSLATLNAHVSQSGGQTTIDLSSFGSNLHIALANYTGDLSHSIFGPPAG